MLARMKAYFYSNWDKLQDARNKYEEVDIYDSVAVHVPYVNTITLLIFPSGFFKINLQGKM